MKTSVDVRGMIPCPTNVAQEQLPMTVTDLGPFDNNRNDILAVNDVRQAAGVSLNPGTGRIEAFIEERGQRSSLGTLGGSFCIAHGINNRSEIVGGSLTAGDDSFHGFLHRDHQLHDLNAMLAREGISSRRSPSITAERFWGLALGKVRTGLCSSGPSCDR